MDVYNSEHERLRLAYTSLEFLFPHINYWI